MASNPPDTQIERGSTAEIGVVIVGENKLHNDLLQSYLEAQDRFLCTCSSCDQLTSTLLSGAEHQAPLILIIDASYFTAHILHRPGLLNDTIRQSGCFPVLFNLRTDQEIEKPAIGCGIRGVFYSDEPIEHLTRGIEAILRGELWYPRIIISDFVLRHSKQQPPDAGSIPPVTRRERQILLELANGASNQEIANRLNISQHTVKTHIYNCYKKIGVANRLQATAWASRHL